jgi:hypothetical protein
MNSNIRLLAEHNRMNTDRTIQLGSVQHETGLIPLSRSAVED